MNWDDLRILDAVRAEGTYAGAGKRLRIDETTVARRLARLQRALGATLFELVDGERRPTARCEEIARHVQSIGRSVSEISSAARRAQGPAGRFRIAATNTIAEEALAPRLEAFLSAHPGIDLQLLTASGNVDFSRWEADFAIRLRRPRRGDFLIAKLAEAALYFFEPRDRSAEEPPLVCGYPEALAATPESMFLAARGYGEGRRCVTDNVRVIRALIASRRAVGVLPEYLCADLLQDPRLKATLLPSGRELWLLTQPHLREDGAARLVGDWIRACFSDR